MVNVRYLLFIGVSFCVILIVIVVVYNKNKNVILHETYSAKTSYDIKNVEGPIQPIPHIKEIDEEWVQLGKALFSSTLLSKDNTISCESCHMLDLGGDDGRPVSVGVNGALGSRNSPSVFNAVFNFRQFWDGRSHDLRDQVSGPVHNPIEMQSSWSAVIEKLSNDDNFRKMFRNLSQDGITQTNIIKAIATFEESLVTPNSPIDRYILGDKDALSESQKRGLDKFISFGCITCHQGRNIGGNIFQKIGRLDNIPDHLLADKGRYIITENEYDKHVFKVPSLRNVALTAPYFHDGSVNDLEEAIRIMAQGQLGMNLGEDDISDLKDILLSFTGEKPQSLR